MPFYGPTAPFSPDIPIYKLLEIVFLMLGASIVTILNVYVNTCSEKEWDVFSKCILCYFASLICLNVRLFQRQIYC